MVLAPTVFKLDGANRAVVDATASVVDITLPEGPEKCPENAMILKDDGGRHIYR